MSPSVVLVVFQSIIIPHNQVVLFCWLHCGNNSYLSHRFFWILRQKFPKKNKVRLSDMLNSYTQKNKYLNLSTTSFFTLKSDFEEKKLHQIKSYYFEKNKVRRADMQSFTDLCVTVQLYTQVSACCWPGRLQQQQHI